MNKRYFLLFTISMFSIFILGLFSFQGFTQTLSESEVLEILAKMKQSRSEISYNGHLEIEYNREKPRKMFFTVWAQPPSIYYLEPKLSYAKRKGQDMQSKYSAKSRIHRHSLQRNNHDFDIFPNRKYLSLFAKNFLVEKHGGETIAQKKTVRLDVKPVHLPSFGIRLWYDDANYFILKREIVYFSDQDEFTTMRHEFNKIEYGVAIPDSIIEKVGAKKEGNEKVRKRPGGNQYKTVSELITDTDAVPFIPEYLPNGFELVAIYYRQETGRNIIHLHYTDGLLNLSIFEIEGPPPKSFAKLLNQSDKPEGQNYNFRQMIIKKVNQYSFLLIGNFSRNEIQQIADSLEKVNR